MDSGYRRDTWFAILLFFYAFLCVCCASGLDCVLKKVVAIFSEFWTIWSSTERILGLEVKTEYHGVLPFWKFSRRVSRWWISLVGKSGRVAWKFTIPSACLPVCAEPNVRVWYVRTWNSRILWGWESKDHGKYWRKILQHTSRDEGGDFKFTGPPFCTQ